MAHSKFVIQFSLLTCICFASTNFANPTSECAEYKVMRAESPRRVLPVKTRVIAVDNQPRENRCCWSILNVFCTLMEHAGSAYPHPIIRDHRNH